MIKKLIKYDLQKMTKLLLYLYFFTIIFAGISRLIGLGNHIQFVFIIQKVFEGITYSLIGSVVINTFVHILMVFYTNFYKDESYLTHTLPITKNKLFASKYISSLIVIFSSVLVCFLSLFIMFYSPEFMQMLTSSLQTIVAGFNISTGLFVTLFMLILFAQICGIIGIAFTAIVKAHTYNTKRVIKGLAWFAIFYLGSMLASLLTISIIFLISGNLSELGAAQLSQSAFLTVLITGLILYVIYAILFYFICNKIFNKGVNVDWYKTGIQPVFLLVVGLEN